MAVEMGRARSRRLARSLHTPSFGFVTLSEIRRRPRLVFQSCVLSPLKRIQVFRIRLAVLPQRDAASRR
jgi:hypothetical protein